MGDQLRNFGETAKGLARNPLGIIALFIVLVYGFASLVTAFAGSFTAAERLPLIYFLILFPVLVLIVFAWLVSKHSGKLFAPSDFRDEENYVKMHMAVVASLGAATAKGGSTTSESDIEKIVEVVRATGPARAEGGDGWRNHILWVDDRPENNTYERQAFEAMAFALRWRCRPIMHSRDWRRIDTRPSSQTWDAGTDLARGTCCLTGCVSKAIRRHSFSMPRRTHRSTSAKHANTEGRGAPTMPRSCSRW